MERINFLQGNCTDIMKRMKNRNYKVDIVLTSPPYNTGRPSNSQRSRDNNEGRYDIHIDNMSAKEYRQWAVDLFNDFDEILNKDGVVLWQTSYGNDGTVNTESIGLMWGAFGHH